MATFIESKIRKNKFTPSNILNYITLIFFACFMAFPLYYSFITAFKPLDEMLLWPPRFYVQRPTLKNFESLITSLDSDVLVPFSRYVFNSLFITVCVVVSTVMFCSMGAYALEKIRMPGHKQLSRVVVYALMFSPPAAAIAVFTIIKNLNMLNSYWALILPAIPTPMYFFLMNQFMTQVPEALLESARIDGASESRIFWTIAMPMVASAAATIVVFSFVGTWGSQAGMGVYITNEALKNLPYAISTLMAAGLARMGAQAAAALLSMLPSLMVIITSQSRIINTMAHAGIKG